jgi:hypothetical protein
VQRLGGLPFAPGPELNMPVRQRKPNELAQQVIPLLLLGIGLVTTNSGAAFLSDEALVLGAAINPLRLTLAQILSGSAGHGYSPLYQIVLHFWLRWTAGNFEYFRIPSILFFLAGLFMLGRVSRRFTGLAGGLAVIWLGALWPFGFHFARLAEWYSLSFFLVAGVTLSYFKYLEEPTPGPLAALFVFCLGLVWTNVFGWALLGCLAVDQILRARSKEPAAKLKSILGTAALLIVAFLPCASAARSELSGGIYSHSGQLARIGKLAFNTFSLFVSESVAPWYWWLSLPAGLAIALCLFLAVRWNPRPSRRFLYYGASLLVILALLGMLETKYLLMVSPWVLLPLGIAIEAAKPRWAATALAAALLVIGAAGWYGMYSRRYYSAPRLIETWQDVAGEAAGKIGSGATVIADHPSFLLYLTYILRVPSQNGPWRFEGLLPERVKHPQVFSPEAWLAAGNAASGKIMLVRGEGDQQETAAINLAMRQLDQTCGSISSRLRMRDSGYMWKQRFFPSLAAPQWRIEIREYDCDTSNSKQIYRTPPQ